MKKGKHNKDRQKDPNIKDRTGWVGKTKWVG